MAKLEICISKASIDRMASMLYKKNIFPAKADTRIFVHVLHSLEQGAMVALVITVDDNVVVILAGKFLDITLLKCGWFPQKTLG